MQISDYLEGLKLETSLIGFVTDGIKGCFVTYNAGKLTAEEFQPLSFDHLDRLIKNIIGLKLTALTSHNLAESFCNPPYDNGMAFALAKELHKNLADKMSSKTRMLFNEWKELFNLPHDDISKQQAIIDRGKSLERLLNISFNEIDEEYMALFALQTAYVIIIKMVAYRIVSIVKYNSSLISFESLIDADSDALRQQLVSLEEGAIFRSYGMTNLLEGDFFSWYSDAEQWGPRIADLIVGILKILSIYSDKPVLNIEKKSTDFF